MHQKGTPKYSCCCIVICARAPLYVFVCVYIDRLVGMACVSVCVSHMSCLCGCVSRHSYKRGL